jgi:beta-lactamase regulating signal transducer with metallopeptidase domain
VLHDVGQLVPLQAVGWTVLQATWQVSLIWLLHLAVQRWALAGTHVRVKYVAACLSLAITAVCLIATFVMARSSTTLFAIPSAATPTLLSNGLYALPDAPTHAWWWRGVALVEPVVPWLCMAWAVGASARLFSTMSGVFALRSLRLGAVDAASFDLDRWRSLADRIAPNARLRFLISPRVETPCVVGALSPIVYLPAMMLANLSPAHVDAIVAHELAHIRRRDYLVNLLQVLLEAVLFFHPLFWLLNRDVRRLREECCDEQAVAILGGRRVFGEALAAFEQMIHGPAMAMALTGATVEGRLRSLVREQRKPSQRGGRSLVASSLGTLLVLVIAFDAGAAKAATSRALERVYEQSGAQSVYALLDAERENDAFLEASELFLSRYAAGVATRGDALAFAEVINRGAPHDALLQRVAPDLDARALAKIRAGSSWRGGGFLNWSNASKWLFLQAKSTTDDRERTALARAALLLSSQLSVTPSMGMLQRIVQDPDLERVVGSGAQLTSQLRTVARAAHDRQDEGQLFLDRFDDGQPLLEEHIQRFVAIARATPYFQWAMANRLETGSYTTPAAERLLLSELPLTRQLLQSAKSGHVR